MSDRKKPSVAFWLAVTAVLLAPLAAYVAAYLILVEPATYALNSPGGGIQFFTDDLYRLPGSDDYLGVELSRWVFAPVNRLDRAVRPDKWRPESESVE